MSRKRLTKEQQLELDTEHLNDAVDELMAQIEAVVPGADVDLQRQAIQSKMRLDAIKLLPSLLERKAKLLGLDFVHPAESPGQDGSGTIEQVTRRLEAISGGKKA
jgi:hypothetical protein